LKWDGTNLDLNVDNKFKVSSAGAVTATSGTIGGWTLSSTLLSASNTYIQAGSSPYIGIKATDLMQKGIWFGESSFVGSLIPFLQSNTYGNLEVSASISSNNVWLAFNGNPDVVWNSGTHSDAAINIDVDFGENTLVNCVQIYFPDQSLSSKTFSIQGSSDGSSWTTISASFVNTVGHSGWYSASLFKVYNYRYYRILFAASKYTGTSLTLGQINFKLTAVYPKDTSKITASDYSTVNVPSNAFDTSLSTAWLVVHDDDTQWLKVELDNAREVTSYRFYSTVAASAPNNWTFEGSNDNVTWDVLDTRSSLSLSANTWYSYTCTSSGLYKYYKWVFTAPYTHDTYLRLTEAEMLISDNYAFSISNGAESYMYWDRGLKLKGDLYLGEGDNAIYFEDSQLLLGDNEVIYDGDTVQRYIRIATMKGDVDTIVSGIGYFENSEDDIYQSIFSVQNRFADYDTPSEFVATVTDGTGTPSAVTLYFCTYNDARTNKASEVFQFLRDDDTSTSGYFNTGSAIKSVIPYWYGAVGSPTTKTPAYVSWTSADNCPFSNIWVWGFTVSGGAEYRLYVRDAGGTVRYVQFS